MSFSDKKKHKPIRMCINCRVRLEQEKLLRLQCQNQKITTFLNKGRSFYLCQKCLEIKKEAIKKRIYKMCKNSEINISEELMYMFQ